MAVVVGGDGSFSVITIIRIVVMMRCSPSSIL